MPAVTRHYESVTQPFSLYHLPWKSLGLTVCGVILNKIFPKFAPPFLTCSIAMAVTLLVVKLTDRYNITTLRSTKITVDEFRQKYPKLHLIVFIFSVAIGYFLPLLGVFGAACIGIYMGFSSRVVQCKLHQAGHVPKKMHAAGSRQSGQFNPDEFGSI